LLTLELDTKHANLRAALIECPFVNDRPGENYFAIFATHHVASEWLRLAAINGDSVQQQCIGNAGHFAVL